MTVFQIFQKFHDFIKRLDSFLGMAAMAFIILLACANVFMRYVIGRPWGWVEEVTVFTFVWLTMIGAAAVVNVEGHCSIDVLVRRFPPKWQRAVGIVSDLVVLVTLILLIVYGIDLTIKGQTKLTPILGIPYSYVDASVPISCAIMLMYYGRAFWANLRGKKDGAEGSAR
jgi:TRAP-type C4-dicarboxylate transport system permease small subunit